MTTSLCFIQMETQRFTLLNQLVERWENQQGKQCRSGKPSNDNCGERTLYFRGAAERCTYQSCGAPSRCTPSAAPKH
jgi:hypothetical protein